MLDTIENVKLNLEIDSEGDDALLESLAAAADAFITDYCGRDFTGGSFSEDHPGGGRYIFLRNFPVDSLMEVNVDPNRTFTPATVLDAARYTLHADRGVLEALGGPFIPGRGAGDAFPNAVRVSYSTPEDAVPKAIQRAFAELIGHWFRQAKTHAAAGQQNLLQRTEDPAVLEYPWGQSGGFRLPAGVQQILNLYRVPP